MWRTRPRTPTLRASRGEQGRAGGVPPGPGGGVGRVRHPRHLRRRIGAYRRPRSSWPSSSLGRLGAGDGAAGRPRVLRVPVCGAGVRRPAPTCCGGSEPTTPPNPQHLQDLPDGSWLAELRPAGNAERGQRADARPGHRLHHRRRPRQHRPATGCSPPCSIPTRRRRSTWPPPTRSGGRSSSTFDELKTHQRGPRTRAALEVPGPGPPGDLGAPVLPLRDPHPDGRGRHHAGHDPDRVSFVAALRIARRPSPTRALFPRPARPRQPRLAGRPPPTAPPTQPSPTTALDPARHQTQDVKWHVKRARHATWPQPRPPTSRPSPDLTERYWG